MTRLSPLEPIAPLPFIAVPPVAVCDTCKRGTWQFAAGAGCGFPQEDGVSFCQGVFR